MDVDRIGRVKGQELERFLSVFQKWSNGMYSVEILVQEDGVKFRVGDAGAWSPPFGETNTRVHYGEGEVAPYLVSVGEAEKQIGTFGCVCVDGFTASDFDGLCGMCGGRYISILEKG